MYKFSFKKESGNRNTYFDSNEAASSANNAKKMFHENMMMIDDMNVLNIG